MAMLITTHGPKSESDLGLILPHEHIFVDLRHPAPPDFAQAVEEDVVHLMAPELERARRAGVTALVECTPEGVGRRADLVRAVAREADFPVVVPTGIYREPWVPLWAQSASEDQLYHWMKTELEGEIDGTGVRAGFIKLSAGDDGLTPLEAKILRAAVCAARETNAVIASHTIRGRVVRDQLAIIEAGGYQPNRFIWVHTQAEPDFDLHLELARRGVWIEYDNLGWNPEEDGRKIESIRRLLEAGFGGQILLSHDMGWYTPAEPNGGTPRPYTYLVEHFIPKLRIANVEEAIIHQLTCTNPFRAFAR